MPALARYAATQDPAGPPPTIATSQSGFAISIVPVESLAPGAAGSWRRTLAFRSNPCQHFDRGEEASMGPIGAPFTSADWLVKEGDEQAFVERWRSLAEISWQGPGAQ